MLSLFSTLFSPPRHLILLVLAAWVGLTLAEKRSERHGISRENISNLIFYGLIAFLLGGRISFVLQHISAFTKSPLDVFSINPDTFDAFGALVATALTFLIFGQKNQLALWPMLDALTPFFATIAVGLGLSHLASGTAFGIPTDIPWSIELWNASRHPSQIYEILASSLILGLLWFKKHDPPPGLLFLIFTSLTAGSFVFLSAFRGDQTLILNGVKQGQLVALAFLAISFILLELRFREVQNKEIQGSHE
jgi:phosphatidylglycerol---prolipoprotein diacylglyceryl transferase